jgi:charged multivesicular body protein 3
LKQLAKKNDVAGCKLLAKELVRSKKHKERLHTSRAHLNSISMQLQHQQSMIKMAGVLKRSTEIMKSVNRLMRVPVIAQQVQEMAMEMTKAGVIEEMMQDTMELLDDDELEEEADEEVDKILFQVTDGKLGELGTVGTLPTLEVEEEGPVLEDMQARLQALRE